MIHVEFAEKRTVNETRCYYDIITCKSDITRNVRLSPCACISSNYFRIQVFKRVLKTK